MKQREKKVPAKATYDYTDIFGRKIYHTSTRRYAVREYTRYGKKIRYVESEPKED